MTKLEIDIIKSIDYKEFANTDCVIEEIVYGDERTVVTRANKELQVKDITLTSNNVNKDKGGREVRGKERYSLFKDEKTGKYNLHEGSPIYKMLRYFDIQDGDFDKLIGKKSILVLRSYDSKDSEGRLTTNKTLGIHVG